MTLSDLKRGVGFFVGGEWTMIYSLGDGDYMTCSKSETPRNPDAEFCGGGFMDDSGKVHINWC